MSEAARSNLERQSIVVAAILEKMLEGGVLPEWISAETFSAAYAEAGYPARFDSESLIEDIIAWLDREQIIFVKNSMQGTEGEMVWECGLTAKGIHLVQTPTAIFGGLTPQQVIEGKAKGDAPASQYVKAGSFLGGLFGGAIKSMSG
uniref:Uncharacterized protein n=1 Tax=Bosea vaviloviae TaxID=1526658 RepID=A0A0N1FEG4_9HYPH|nr:hypothetical protein [Bosea vaviloviae]KPH80673.1 hypothetical protein AE618_13120 [Bosea vaviloviae]